MGQFLQDICHFVIGLKGRYGISVSVEVPIFLDVKDVSSANFFFTSWHLQFIFHTYVFRDGTS